MKPVLCNYYVTYRCNATCSFCDIWEQPSPMIALDLSRLQFDLPETAEVSVEIIDVLGRNVLTLPAKQFEAGANRSLEINASNLASGTYLYRVLVRSVFKTVVRTGHMTLVK